MPSILNRLQHGWNAFMGRDPTPVRYDFGYSSSYRPDRVRFSRGNERSIVTAVYNRLATDVSEIDIKHVRVDADDRYVETIYSGLNNVLTLDANEDQTGRAFIKDIVMSMFDEGVVAVVPTDTSINPKVSGSFDIEKVRTGKIINWYPGYVTVQVYNEKTANKEEITLPKKMVAIIENPFYAVMNEPNSTLQRLIRTLNQLDILNSQNSSGKLDLIIQLPYVIRNETQKHQAELRRKDIEAQLIGSKYGIAYTDGTERITQLNRPVENNLWTQVKELTSMLYNQLGLTQSILDGTADEKAMINYYNNTINPILHAICEEMMRKFLTKTARTQGQAIMYFRNPFGLVPVSQIADIADKFTRNEIASSNEMRAIIGWKPSNDPRADELRNKNLNQNTEDMMPLEEEVPMDEPGDIPYEEDPNSVPPEEQEDVPAEGEEIDQVYDALDALLERIEALEEQLNNGENQNG
jgi:hypothetical protein